MSKIQVVGELWQFMREQKVLAGTHEDHAGAGWRLSGQVPPSPFGYTVLIKGRGW